MEPLSNPDTNGAEESVIVSEVSSFQRLKCTQEWFLVWEKVSCLVRCPQSRGPTVDTISVIIDCCESVGDFLTSHVQFLNHSDSFRECSSETLDVVSNKSPPFQASVPLNNTHAPQASLHNSRHVEFVCDIFLPISLMSATQLELRTI